MKTKFFALALLTGMFATISYAQVLNKREKKGQESTINEIKEQVPPMKTEARASLDPYRYDASKVTYFLYKPFTQRKEVEIYFFNSAEYKIAFQPGLVKDPIKVQVFDRPKDYKNRTLLFEKNGVSGGIFHTTSSELLANLKSKKIEGGMAEAEAAILRLKKVYIDYIIPTKEKEVTVDPKTKQETIVRTKGAMIISMGYDNL